MQITTPDYSMYTPAGNAAVDQMVRRIKAAILTGGLTRKGLPEAIVQGCNYVEETYGEVWDSEPQHDIAYALSETCQEQMWLPIDRYEW